MTSIGVFGDVEALQIKNLLLQLYKTSYRPVSVVCLGAEEYPGWASEPFNMLIINESSRLLPGYAANLFPQGILIANGDDKEIRPYLRGMKSRLITYGFSRKASVTTSSVALEEMQKNDRKKIQCCIQRSFPTFSGKMLEEQEFSMEIQNAQSIYSTLGALTAALLDDIPCPL